MHKNKQDFKNTMYAYDNINEYYSYYGEVIYISTDYIIGNNYFIILRNADQFALVYVPYSKKLEFDSFKNRDNLVEELDKLSNTINFISGFPNFIRHIGTELVNLIDVNKVGKRSINELNRLRNDDLIYWNHILIEQLFLLYKKDLMPYGDNLLLQTKMVKPEVYVANTILGNCYNKLYTFTVEWISKNGFIDIEIIHFAEKYTKRLYIFDIYELSKVLYSLSRDDDTVIKQKIYDFINF